MFNFILLCSFDIKSVVFGNLSILCGFYLQLRAEEDDLLTEKKKKSDERSKFLDFVFTHFLLVVYTSGVYWNANNI